MPSRTYEFVQLDVFTRTPLAGNPLAIFTDARGLTRVHNAMDIMAPRGTAVLAVDGGRVSQLGNGGAGGITVYEVDDRGRYAFYYAHLDRYGAFKPGDVIYRGNILGYVGNTGNARTTPPHLHYGVDDPARGAVNPWPLLNPRLPDGSAVP